MCAQNRLPPFLDQTCSVQKTKLGSWPHLQLTEYQLRDTFVNASVQQDSLARFRMEAEL